MRIIFLISISIKSFILIILFSVLISCNRSENNKAKKSVVVVYTSLDRPHSQHIFELFEKETGIKVKAVYDTEAVKTVGLANRLVAERTNPQADVFWNSEVLRSIMLKRKGVLLPYLSPNSFGIPDEFKDMEGYWTGFAARARVIAFSQKLKNSPKTYTELLLPKWKDKIAIANPLFGTTAGQVAVWFDLWGEDKAKKYLQGLKNNGVKICAGNAIARDMVLNGEVEVCLTDTDDVYSSMKKGRDIKFVFPDQGEDEEGTLLIPNTVCIIKNSPNPKNAVIFADFLLSRKVELMLAKSLSGQIPLHNLNDKEKKGVPFLLDDIRYKQVDFEAAADKVEKSSEWIEDNFLR